MNSVGIDTALEDEDILLQQNYLGYTFVIMANRSLGVRNGYVRLPLTHPFHRMLEENELSDKPVPPDSLLRGHPCTAVLGGITFCYRSVSESNFWFGFTTADGNFKPDPELFRDDWIRDIQVGFYEQLRKGKGRIYTTEMVAESCRHLVELLLIDTSLSSQKIADIDWTSPAAIRIIRENAKRSLTL